MKRFNAKFDGLLLFIFTTFSFGTALMLILQKSFIPLIILALVVLFILNFFLLTAYYITDEGLLLIKIACITTSKIKIKDIKTIRLT
jgi:hypothetical protein